MEQRLDEEESATDVSRDSGNVSQSDSSGSVISEGLSSGNISHSHSFSAAVLQEDGGPDRLLEHSAVESLEKSLEEMLTRVDEFVGMLDMVDHVLCNALIHWDTETLMWIKLNMCLILIQAFVKMVGHNVTVMEEQVTQAESDLGAFPSAFKKIFCTITVPAFLNVSTLPFSKNITSYFII
ncbi:BL1S4 protein, partial [Polyodon spathula]|nr:BL1S4 protein [Polyodon spathula]